MSRAERAGALFREGYNCAQAVVLAFADLIGMDRTQALRISAPFGGGIARQREVCGAVSGMCIVAGALFGYDDPTDREAKRAHYALVQELCARFRASNGTIICGERLAIKSADLKTPDPTPRTAAYYRTRPCEAMVVSAAEILEDYIQSR